MGDVPSTSQLLDSRVQQFTDRAAQARVSLESAPLLLGPSLQLPVPHALQQRNPAGKLGSSLVSIGEGLPAISEHLFQRIGEGKYIYFSDVPPAKGKPRALPAQLDGQPILIPLQDATGDTKKLLPDFPFWAQCLTVYTAAAPTTGTKPDGLHVSDGQECQKVHVALLGYLRPELSSGQGRSPGLGLV